MPYIDTTLELTALHDANHPHAHKRCSNLYSSTFREMGDSFVVGLVPLGKRSIQVTTMTAAKCSLSLR